MNRARLDDRLADLDTDGYLIDASQDDANQLYLSGFTGPDPFLTLYADGEIHVLVGGLEYGRARKEATADTVERHADYDYEYGGREARNDMYARFVRDKGVESVSMPPRGPVGTRTRSASAGSRSPSTPTTGSARSERSRPTRRSTRSARPSALTRRRCGPPRR